MHLSSFVLYFMYGSFGLSLAHVWHICPGHVNACSEYLACGHNPYFLRHKRWKYFPHPVWLHFSTTPTEDSFEPVSLQIKQECFPVWHSLHFHSSSFINLFSPTQLRWKLLWHPPRHLTIGSSASRLFCSSLPWDSPLFSSTLCLGETVSSQIIQQNSFLNNPTMSLALFWVIGDCSKE